ncbi:hypothetical protein H2203_005571 [Taxawa tesnikishii (nom. ined.)]|nr:hypothetical protein H2203_005571 [Dothideales sp. JES 119]
MKRLNARLPPTEDISSALKAFFKHLDEQMQYILPAFKYLQEQGAVEGLSQTLMLEMLQVSTRIPEPPSANHLQFATEVYNEIQQRTSSSIKQKRAALVPYVQCLSHNGQTSTARDLIRDLQQSPSTLGAESVEEDSEGSSQNASASLYRKCWTVVMNGYRHENNEQELLHAFEEARKLSTVTTRPLHIKMAQFYASRDDVEKCREWFDRAVRLPEVSDAVVAAKQMEDLCEDALRLCLRKSQLDWGQSVIRQIMTASPSKPLWDLVFVWASGTGKGVDEIDRMIGVMEKANQEIADRRDWRVPDIDTINKLVEFAISRNDPYMAERFIEVGRKRNIQPNAKTLVLQMDYRLSVKDVDGALIAYKHLQAHDLSAEEDVPATNRLLRAMCTSGRHDFDSIMNVAADLSDRRVRFEPATVSALSVLHLRRAELHDVIDLLNTHAFHYSIAERAQVRDTFVSYCLDPATTTAQAWDAYAIFRQVFDETPRDLRTKVMNEFFRRERPDMAAHVFNHMRTHTRGDTIPTVDTYITCFRGIARLRDEESLEVVHNQLKLDFRIEPETRLLNALMLAYAKCGSARRALGFWDDIVASSEGPTINSLHLAFRACEDSPWGDVTAKEIWQRLVRTGMDFDRDLWASYAGALIGNGDVDATVRVLEEAEAKGKSRIGSMYNAVPGASKREDIEAWAKETHPQAWRELEAIGREKNPENANLYFNIDREIEP